jgi:excisionase family DNA binding protein
MPEVMTETANKIAAGYAAMVADLTAASDALRHAPGKHDGALAAGYVAASAAADQAGAAAPFPLLPLPGSPARPSPLDVLTLAEAAEYLQLPEAVVRAEAEAGRLVGRNVGGEWRFVRQGVADWLRVPARRPQTIPALPHPQETPEEQEAFLAGIRAYRDEIDRVTGSGKYAPE